MRLAESIISAILGGVYPVGSRLEPRILAHELHQSPDRIQAALTEVCARGLGVRLADDTVQVQPTQLPVILDKMEALGEIQALCAGLAARRAPISDLPVLEDIVSRLEEMDFDTYRRIIVDLHDNLCQLSKNTELSQQARSLRQQMLPILTTLPDDPDRRRWSADDHRALIGAIGERNEILAATIMRGHVRALGRQVVFSAAFQPDNSAIS